jgi:hydroxypyruvate isomerase
VFTLGAVHYASFPDARGNPKEFWRSLDQLLADPLIQIVELSCEVPDAAAARLGDLFRAAKKRLYLSAGPVLRDTPGLCTVDAKRRREVLAAAKNVIETAAAIAAENLMVVSGPDPGPEGRTQAYEALHESIVELSEHAAAAGAVDLTLSIEPFARTTPPFQLVGPTSEVGRLLARLDTGRSRLRLTADLAHFAQLGEDPVRSIERLGARAEHIHVSTCVLIPNHPLFGDFHPSFDEPGIAVSLRQAAQAVAQARRATTSEIVASIEVRPPSAVRSDATWKTARDHLGTIARMAEELI